MLPPPSPGPQAPEAEVRDITFQRRGGNKGLAAGRERRTVQDGGTSARTGPKSQRHQDHDSLPAAGEEDVLLHPGLSEVTPAKGEQQESPNSLGETKEPQHSRLGEHFARETYQAQLLLLFWGVSVPFSVPALSSRGGIRMHCRALQRSVGSASSYPVY